MQRSDEERRACARAYYARNRERIAAQRAVRAMRREALETRKAAETGGCLATDPESTAVDGCSQYTPRQLCDAKRRIERANDWIETNPGAWAYISRRAREETEARRRFAIRGLIHEARQKDFTNTEGRTTSISNGFSAYFCRLLCKEIEGMARFVEQRPTPVDEVMADG